MPRTDADVGKTRRARTAACVRRRQGDAGGDGRSCGIGGDRETRPDATHVQDLTTREALARELAATRERGFAIDDEEHAEGLFCVAAPVWDENGEPWAAISLAGPTSRLVSARVPELGRLVRTVAGELTAALGGQPQHA